MKSISLLLPLLLLPFMFNCSLPVSTGPSDIPNMVRPSDLPDTNMFFRLPPAISYAQQNSGETALPLFLAKRSSSLQSMSSTPLFEIYGVVPALIHRAEALKMAMVGFMGDLAGWGIAHNDTVQHEIWTVATAVRDTSVDGVNFQHFAITIRESGEMVLLMDYFKNSSGGFRGSFFYSNNSANEDESAVWMNFSNLNSNPPQEEMHITFYNPVDSLIDVNQPSVVRYTAIRRGERIAVRGFAYMPVFYDDFLGEGPKFYVFNAATRTDRNSALVNVAFVGPENVQNDSLFINYSLSEVLLQRAVYTIRDSLRVNNNLAQAFFWSIETEQMIEESRYVEIALHTPEGTIDEIDTDDLRDFLELNPNLRGASAEFQNFYEFTRTRQPVFFTGNGAFLGDYDDLLPEDLEELGLTVEDIEDYLLDFDVIERVREYDPEEAMYDHWIDEMD